MIIKTESDVTTAVLAELQRAPDERSRQIMRAAVMHNTDDQWLSAPAIDVTALWVALDFSDAASPRHLRDGSKDILGL